MVINWQDEFYGYFKKEDARVVLNIINKFSKAELIHEMSFMFPELVMPKKVLEESLRAKIMKEKSKSLLRVEVCSRTIRKLKKYRYNFV